MPEVRGTYVNGHEVDFTVTLLNNFGGTVRILHHIGCNDTPNPTLRLSIQAHPRRPKSSLASTFLLPSDARALAAELVLAAKTVEKRMTQLKREAQRQKRISKGPGKQDPPEGGRR